jgi:hypothetical protein
MAEDSENLTQKCAEKKVLSYSEYLKNYVRVRE